MLASHYSVKYTISTAYNSVHANGGIIDKRGTSYSLTNNIVLELILERSNHTVHMQSD